MKRQDFLKAVRQDGAALRVDNISVDTRTAKFSGKGMLRVVNARFILDVTLDDHQNVPVISMGIKDRSEFWKISGLLENEIEFQFEGMPNGRQDNYGHHPWKIIPISSCYIDLTPAGWDALTTAERQKAREDALNAFQAQQEGGAQGITNEHSPAPNDIDNAVVKVLFDAVLRDYKLIAFNGGTVTTVKNDFFEDLSESSATDTFHGRFEGWKFGLIQKGADLDIHFWSEASYTSISEDEDHRIFRAFLDTVAFTHGKHTWPFSMEHRRDGKLILDRVQLADDVAQTAHGPFTESLDGNARMGTLKWNFLEPLEAAHRFFCMNTSLSSEVKYLLYLFREASSVGVPKRIALLGLCSLFESLVHTIYAERIALNENGEKDAFEKAREESLAAIKLAAEQSGNPGSYSRIIAILNSASPLRMRDEFDAVITHLFPNPGKWWGAVFDLWRDYRNPLSHRLSQNDKSNAAMKDELLAESKIAGAINCLILKLMGYSGLVRLSAYEDQYGQI